MKTTPLSKRRKRRPVARPQQATLQLRMEEPVRAVSQEEARARFAALKAQLDGIQENSGERSGG